MKPISEKQLELIKSIEEALGIKFTGTTGAGATMFITRNLQAYRDYLVEIFDYIHNENNY